MMMVVFRHCWLVFGTISFALHPPPLFPFCGQSLLCFNTTTLLYFLIQCFVCFATKEAAASGLHQSGFVSKPVEADVELSLQHQKHKSPLACCAGPLGVSRGF
uniref:Uncharacterized protein n=1 Tax=Meloidogyne enterolobii TaxID=390850 RepID=A0A6V7X9D6_MELEN|nr:unnamed protein product [Meloidogyne enterolobii]